MLRNVMLAGRRFRSRPQLVPFSNSQQLSTTAGSSEATHEVALLRSRLLYQSKKRGIKECDIIIGGFAENHLAGMGVHELRDYEKIINGDYMEWDLYYFFAGRKEPPPELRNSPVFQRMKEFANSTKRAY